MTDENGPREPGRHPGYHGTDHEAAAGSGEPLTARRRRARAVVIAIVAAIVLAILIMHLTGAMPNGTGP